MQETLDIVGGEGRTRTCEAMRRLIYSQLPLPLGTLPLNSIATQPPGRQRQGRSMTLKPKDPIFGLPVGRVYGGSATAKSTNGSCQYRPRWAQIAIIRNP